MRPAADSPTTSVVASIRLSRPSASCDGLATISARRSSSHQQVPQVACEERHLVSAGYQHLLCGNDRVNRSLDVRTRKLVGGVLHV